MSEDIEAAWVPEFKPGWPDIYPLGLLVGRSGVGAGREPQPVEDDDEPGEELTWLIHVGVSDEVPKLAFFGDLTIRHPDFFAGITVIMPFAIRDEPEVLPEGYADDVVRRYGEWASSIMYD